MRGLLLITTIAACAHAPSRREQVLRSFRSTVAEDLGAVALKQCGDVSTSYEDVLARDTCFTQAFRECRPAQVWGAYHGIDSGPFYWSAAVVTTAGGCEIRYYEDTRNDGFGAHEIRRHRCTGTRTSDCKLVWREDHSLCRETMHEETGAPATSTCVALPPDVRWTER